MKKKLYKFIMRPEDIINGLAEIIRARAGDVILTPESIILDKIDEGNLYLSVFVTDRDEYLRSEGLK